MLPHLGPYILRKIEREYFKTPFFTTPRVNSRIYIQTNSLNWFGCYSERGMKSALFQLPLMPAPKNVWRDLGHLMRNKAVCTFLVFTVLVGTADGFLTYFLFWWVELFRVVNKRIQKGCYCRYIEDIAKIYGTENIKLLEGAVIAAGTLGGSILFFHIGGISTFIFLNSKWVGNWFLKYFMKLVPIFTFFWTMNEIWMTHWIRLIFWYLRSVIKDFHKINLFTIQQRVQIFGLFYWNQFYVESDFGKLREFNDLYNHRSSSTTQSRIKGDTWVSRWHMGAKAKSQYHNSPQNKKCREILIHKYCPYFLESAT